jgi:hypothetical protein
MDQNHFSIGDTRFSSFTVGESGSLAAPRPAHTRPIRPCPGSFDTRISVAVQCGGQSRLVSLTVNVDE